MLFELVLKGLLAGNLSTALLRVTVSLSRYLVVKSMNLFLHKDAEMPKLFSLNGNELIPICLLLVNILLKFVSALLLA